MAVRQRSLDGLQPEVRQRAEWVLAQGDGRIGVSSAYRSSAEQRRLYERWRRGQGAPANRPGTSKHETGEAVDFDVDPNTRGEYAYMQQVARRGGFRFPVVGEPWHAELDPWRGPLPEEDDMTPEQAQQLADIKTMVAEWLAPAIQRLERDVDAIKKELGK